MNYVLGEDAGVGPFIHCLECQTRSYNPTDIRERYCGYCHIFHDDQKIRELNQREQEIIDGFLSGRESLEWAADELYKHFPEPKLSRLEIMRTLIHRREQIEFTKSFERKTLETIIYDADRKLPLKLYVYRADGYHTGGKWFRNVPRYPDEEITTPEAMLATGVAMQKGLEVRICNGGDFCVFHFRHGQVIYPPEGADAFWESLLAQ